MAIGGIDLRLPLEASAVAATHRWRRVDLVMRDNRCAMHRRDAFDPAARRILHRTQPSASSR